MNITAQRARSLTSLLVALTATSFLASSASAELIYAHSRNLGNNYLTFDSGSPTALLTAEFMNSRILGFDTVPDRNALVRLVLDSTNPTRVYVESYEYDGPFNPPYAAHFTVVGTSIGFAYNPVDKRFHVVTDFEQNSSHLTENDPYIPDIFLPALHYAAGDVNAGVNPNVVYLAYTNNKVGAVSTTAYAIDSALDVLLTLDEATGALHTVGPLGVDVTPVGEFMISGRTGIAYAAIVAANSSQSTLYTINLATGAATGHGPIGPGLVIDAITVRVPEPTGLALAVFGLASAMFIRSRKP